jgi:putative tRNA adenosine deaminase-associated protein
VSYFTAVLSRTGKDWRVHDVLVDDVEPSALVDELRMLAEDDDPVLLLIEREDEWWGVLRVDGAEDPRVFVSDVDGAERSPFSELLSVELVEPVVATVDDDDTPVIGGGGCGGDFDVLTDFGTSADDLRALCDDGALPMDALAAVAEPAGFAEVLDSLR